MGERPDQIKEATTARDRGDRLDRLDHDVRDVGSEEVVGRGVEEGARQTPDDTARIRSEIARTRADMSGTIDAIQDKLSPRNLAAQAKESMKEATIGRVRQAAASVGETASSVAEQTRDVAADVADTVKHNPWPALLIGVGTAWLLIDKGKSGGRRSFTEREDHDDGTTGYYDVDSARAGGRSAARASYRTAGSDASAYGSSDAGSSQRLEESGRHVMTSARQGLSRASSQVQGLLERNPMVVGALAAAVGVAVGLALPETERENRLMGEARDTLVEQAQTSAQDAVEKVKQVAGDAVGKL